MTKDEKEQLIRHLKYSQEIGADYLITDEDAVEIIKALEQPSYEDCISREDAIRIAEQGQIQGYEWQFKKLCNLPSVTPQQTRWIPVSERLPEEVQKVLVIDKFETVTTAIYFEKSQYWRDMVVAWMPLPQPCKSESEK